MSVNLGEESWSVWCLGMSENVFQSGLCAFVSIRENANESVAAGLRFPLARGLRILGYMLSSPLPLLLRCFQKLLCRIKFHIQENPLPLSSPIPGNGGGRDPRCLAWAERRPGGDTVCRRVQKDWRVEGRFGSCRDKGCS